MVTYGLGIDTGGTYTDTVVIENETGMVLCSNKALTTREDLSIGIRNSLGGLDPSLLKKVVLTSLSSTLATNAVVENKGCRVGLICIGKSYVSDIRPECYAEVSGRFNMSGEEIEKLGISGTKQALNSMKGKIDALAIAGYVSVRNPSHEERVAKMARRILDVPVVCAHDLTSKLGFEQRATTAIMNARLIPTIKELLVSVKTVLKEFGVRSPLMVVKGDGALMKEDTAVQRPVESILSGPASSLTGAKALTGRADAVMIDIGGTTSDIGVLKHGFPRIEPEGARIAGKRTRVMAADISTYGIGGDSRIVVNGREIVLSSVRVIPICIAAKKWPSVKRKLKQLESETDDRSAEKGPLEDIVQDTEFFTLAHNNDLSDFTREDRRFANLLKKSPARLTDAAEKFDIPAHMLSAREMESRGCITRIGVTPTDILHAEGSYVQYDADASHVAVAYLARKCGKSFEQFIEDTKEAIVKKIAACTMEKILLDESGSDRLSETQTELIDSVLYRNPEDYSMKFTLRLPIIGIGAPVGAWLPKVAEYLGTELLLPENAHIGNAIGAITGSICETVVITVRAHGQELVENPECDVFTGREIRSFVLVQDALDFAEAEGTRMATEKALHAGSKNPVIEVFPEINTFEVSDNKRIFRGATITVKATGKPDLY